MRSYPRALSAKTRNTREADVVVDAVVHARHSFTRTSIHATHAPARPRHTSHAHALPHSYTSFVHARHLHTRSFTRAPSPAIYPRHLTRVPSSHAILTRAIFTSPSYTRAIFTRDPPRTRGTRPRHPKTAIPHAIRIYHTDQLLARHPFRVSGLFRDKTKPRVANS
jgi:hypothetical protein